MTRPNPASLNLSKVWQTSKVFVLSPSNMRGIRARGLLSETARVSLARPRRTTTLTLEEAFTYTSSLYFRGKIAYARRFMVPPPACDGIYIIAPGFGLVPPGWPLTRSRFDVLRVVPVDPRHPRYRRPLQASAHALAARLEPDTQIVLLGSLAQGKYLGILSPIFQHQLIVPRSFVGMGDMRRGAVLLRAAASGEELDYLHCSDMLPLSDRRPGHVRDDTL